MKKYSVSMTVKKLKSLFTIKTDGNAKLKCTEKVKFFIFNLPAFFTCPFAGGCVDFCYAQRPENDYRGKVVNPSRMRNYRFSKSEDFVPCTIEFIAIQLNKLQDGEKVFFRIHESGDFYSIEYIHKWVEVMRYFEGDDRIQFMAYSRSIRFFRGIERPKNFLLRASVDNCTTEDDLRLIEEMGLPVYRVVDESTTADLSGYARCRCADCGNCLLCYNRKVKNVYVDVH